MTRRTDPGAALGLPKPRLPARLPRPGQKVRRRPVQWEEQYQRTVADFFAWALPRDVLWYAVPNGGWRTKAIAARLKACGVKPGVHDFVLVYQGRHYELELKAKGGTMSPEQREHALKLVAVGGYSGVAADTLEDVIRQLDEWGIPHATVRGRVGVAPK